MNIYSKNYINKLKSSAQRLTSEKVFPVSLTPYTPLTQQIRDMSNSLPANLLHRPWTMAELVARLHGKYRTRPHPQKVAEALKILGWEKDRHWKKGFDGARVWTCPKPL